MTSKLTFYLCDITPERNCVVDDLVGYLSSLTSQVVNDFQYIKLDLDLHIKVNSSQVNVPKFNYNYVAVKNSDLDKVYYYFIIGSPTWISSSTIQLQLSLDTLNTFKDDLTWTAKTNITRQHKDRFTTNYATTALGKVFHRKIDNYDEGFAPTKYYQSENSIRTYADYDFYLIYRNKEGLTANSTVPMECYLCASQEINLNITVDKTGIDFSDYNVGDSLYTFSKDNPEFTTTINGTSYTIGGSSEYKGIAFVKRSANNVAYLLRESDAVLTGPIGNSALTDVTATLKVRVCRDFDPGEDTAIYNYYYILGQVEAIDYSEITVGQTSATLLSINSVNRTDTRIVKIIKMPYAPFTVDFTSDNKLKIPTGWTYSGGYLLLNDLNTEFLNIIEENDDLSGIVNLTLQANEIGKDKANDIKYESKLYNSNFFSLKYIYDNFEKEFLLERYSTNDTRPGIAIRFKQSNNISSNSLFRLNPVNGYYDEPTLYGEFLNVNRQNEVALYNSDYLNYIRTGYNYDKKARTRQMITSAISVGGSLAASIASKVLGGSVFGAASAISLASSAVNSFANAINTAIGSEQAIQLKLDTARMSASSVSNTEDLNLLSYYNGNRLIRYTETINDNIKQGLYNLFRLTGYACNEYAIPTFDSRLYYNFIQCKADFEESKWTYGKVFLDDIKARYEVGVTYFHKVDNSYDFLQTKENFEKWMIEA